MAAYLPLSLAILVSLLAAAAASDHGDYSHPNSGGEKKLVVQVEGMVYAQSCAHRNSWCLDGATPLPGAKVTVTCRDRKNRVMAWRSVKADGNGYYLADLGDGPPAAAYYKGDPTKACFVRLLSSPDRKCDDLTNINYGIQGAPIRDEGKGSPADGYALYAAGPLAFRPRHCAPRRHY
ncbi:hypothetical protein QYE76_049860 [Lolium multiflorum]|jgi:hypothetical protein|uniref:Pollen Ole e 1 allergen and extensin family protein n=1 Tax=Lolium multiflorum TaxID=4521 RepID=A0AAD8SQM5_LOLMU|nr:non-classical arabinogalactan protein 30-like [Lolium perenne]KAK1661701.1 hypothetical protein QYE76_049860 [Lolium multiflorum]